MLSSLTPKRSTAVPDRTDPPQDFPGMPQKISFATKFRGEQPNRKELRQDEDRKSLSGLRNTTEATSRLPGHIELGSSLAAIFHKVLREIPLQRNLLITLGFGRVPETEQEVALRELDNFLSPVRQKLVNILSSDQSKTKTVTPTSGQNL